MSVFISAEQAMNEVNRQFIDCRHLLTDPDFGYTSYQKEHLPNAIFAHLDDDLSSPPSGKNGRHPLPELSRFHSWLQDNGISPDKFIICYDNFSGGIAARLWWMLIQLHYPNVRIMIESIEVWKSKGFPVEHTNPVIEKIEFDLPVDKWEKGTYQIKSLEEIAAQVPSTHLIDSRAPERHHGETEPYDQIAGTIPGSVNIYWQSHLHNDKIRADCRILIEDIIDIGQMSDYTVYCGSGVTAAYNLAVFEELSLDKPAIFPGSYSMWSQNYPNNVEQKNK